MSIWLIRNKPAREIVAALEREFWALSHVRGSHHYYVRAGIVITVPYHKDSDTLSRGVLGDICDLAGWELRRDFVRAGLIKARGTKEKKLAVSDRQEIAAQYDAEAA